MKLTEEQAQEIGEEESTRWSETHAAVIQEIRRTSADYEEDRKLARDLTSQIVAATRDEDKAALASDEAVAHGLTKLRKDKTEGLDSLVEQPYFARVVTDEVDEDGVARKVEFRLGTASFPAQRIIDWRKAPISKLYYDYKEGDDFSETIQGRERDGVIQLRRSFHGRRADLNIVETSRGTIAKHNGKWKIKDKGEPLSRTSGHDGHLPPILSLITPEQFGLITRDPQKPIVIQGIAGSGKTTVALHRLAWLIHEDNGGVKPQKCLVVMFNRSLRAYIETTLPELNIQGVPIRTFHQWANQLVTELAGQRPTGVFKKSRELEQFKSSAICHQLIGKYVEKFPDRDKTDWIADLFQFFAYTAAQELFWPKWEQIRSQLKEQVERKACDVQDDPILLHLIYAEHGYYPVTKPESLGLCDHVVIDEAQDFGLMEIRALLNAVEQKRTVTIVGDLAQKIVMGRNFSSWEEMLKDAGFEETTPIPLTVSYRSTEEIMAVAGRIRGADLPAVQMSSQRRGASPTFIRADGAGVLPNLVAQWVRARMQESPNSLSAVICRWPKDAQALVDELRKIGCPSVRWAHREQFEFSPGVNVTNVHQVKGLEFRNVLVVEPSEDNYNAASEEEKNLLYVAATRAEVRLDFIGTQPPTKLLPTLSKGKATL